MVQFDTDSGFLSPEFVLKHGITEIIPLDEGTFEDDKFNAGQKKLVFQRVQCNDKEHMIRKWSPNKTSLKTIAQMYGDDSKAVMGKILKIVIMPTQQSGKNGIFVMLENIKPVVQTQIPTTATTSGTTPSTDGTQIIPHS